MKLIYIAHPFDGEVADGRLIFRINGGCCLLLPDVRQGAKGE